MKPFPAFLGVMDCDDRPAIGRRASRVEDLAIGQAAVGWVHRRDRCLVLLFGTARELMHDPVRHFVLLLNRSAIWFGVDRARTRWRLDQPARAEVWHTHARRAR